MEYQKFGHFKTNFYSKLGDIEILSGAYGNYIKIVLDGVYVRYNEKGIDRICLMWNNVFFYIFCQLKKIQGIFNKDLKKYNNKKIRSKKNVKIWIHDVGRLAKNQQDKEISFYFDRLIKTINLNYIYSSNKSIENYHEHDFQTSDSYKLSFKIHNNFYFQLKNDFKNIVKDIKLKSNFNSIEIYNIKYAFQKTLNQFAYWYNLLEFYKPEKIYFLCHYHNEGMILAAKKLNISIIELQHGLIANSDIFYSFPKEIKSVWKNALFADKILIYGLYWKEVLLKGYCYPESCIELIGYYPTKRLELNKSEEKLLIDHSIDQFVLVTTQPGLWKEFFDYIKRYSNYLYLNKSELKIIVKLHPVDDKIKYMNEFKSVNNVIITKSFSLDALLNLCVFNITIYSTSVFDAIRVGTKSYLIMYANAEDYIKEIALITKTKILNNNTFPKLDLSNNSEFKPNFYYSQFNYLK